VGTEEAVISEPVSACWFPVSRENTGKFADFGLEIAKAPPLSEENSNRLPAEFPNHQNRENLLAIREPEAGNSESDPNNWVSRVGSGTLVF
jgi:hypothetical protein